MIRSFFRTIGLVVMCAVAAPAITHLDANAQIQPTPLQQQQMADFTSFMRAYEARFGPPPPDLRQRMIDSASNAIINGTYPRFMAGLRAALGVAPDFGKAGAGSPRSGRPGRTAPAGGAEAALVGTRVMFVQRRLTGIGKSSASGFVHFCPNGFFYETSETFIQNPASASANVTSGLWRIETGPNGPVAAMYFQQGRRAGQSVKYRLADLQAGRWRTTNWQFAVDRQAQCPR